MRGWITGLFGLLSVAAHGVAAEPTLIWVEMPGIRAQATEHLAEAGHLPWFRAALDRGEMRRLGTEQDQEIARLREEVRSGAEVAVDAGWRVRPANATVLIALAGSLREATAWIDSQNQPTLEWLQGWSGDVEWEQLRHLAGLDGSLRWEEVEEFVSLSHRQNRSLRSMQPAPEHPLWRLRSSFSSDKLFANAALRFGVEIGAGRVFLVQEIGQSLETDLIPWTEQRLAAVDEESPGVSEADDRRFFLRRVRSSRPRVYGRLDRVAQSIQAVWGSDAILVVDASDSDDPFLAVQAPQVWADHGTPAIDLRELLLRLGQLPREDRDQ